MAWFSTLIALLHLAAPAVLFSLSPASAGFSATLIHRNHPNSHLHNPSSTHYEMQKEDILRSFSRAKYLQTRTTNSDHEEKKIPTSVIIPADMMYLMEVSIGTPPFKIQAIADTGSDLTWTQCIPCTRCYPQTDPIFNPSNSTTYRRLSCDSEPCRGLDVRTCDKTNHCRYEYDYFLTSISGDLAAETFTFRSNFGGNISIPAISFGCGHNDGWFQKDQDGIVGLGRGPLSIVKQMDNLVHGRFSYCLPGSTNSSGEIRFGSSAVVSGPGTVSTPLISKKPPLDTFYYVNLEGISLANHESSSSKVYKKSSGNYSIIIDSGSVLSWLPKDIFDELASAIRRNVSAPVVKDPGVWLDLCFRTAAGEVGRNFPDVVVHLTGADVVVPASSAFLGMRDDLTCLAAINSYREPYVLGNTAQKNYHVGFDLQAEKVSFQQTKDCSN